jgi:hypothetical protein
VSKSTAKTVLSLTVSAALVLVWFEAWRVVTGYGGIAEISEAFVHDTWMKTAVFVVIAPFAIAATGMLGLVAAAVWALIRVETTK